MDGQLVRYVYVWSELNVTHLVYFEPCWLTISFLPRLRIWGMRSIWPVLSTSHWTIGMSLRLPQHRLCSIWPVLSTILWIVGTSLQLEGWIICSKNQLSTSHWTIGMSLLSYFFREWLIIANKCSQSGWPVAFGARHGRPRAQLWWAASKRDVAPTPSALETAPRAYSKATLCVRHQVPSRKRHLARNRHAANRNVPIAALEDVSSGSNAALARASKEKQAIWQLVLV